MVVTREELGPASVTTPTRWPYWSITQSLTSTPPALPRSMVKSAVQLEEARRTTAAS